MDGGLRLSISEKQRQTAIELEQALLNAQAVVDKSYLERLDQLEVKELELVKYGLDVKKYTRFFRLERLITNKEENFLDKLVTVANAVAPLKSSLVTVADNDGRSTAYYLGVVPKNARIDNAVYEALRKASADAFSGALTGNFSGSSLKPLAGEELDGLLERIADSQKSIAAVSGVVSLRNKTDRDAKTYVQGLENLVNSLKGKPYTIIMIADPVESEQIRAAKQGYEMLSTQLSLFQNCTVTLNESASLSLTQTQTEGVTTGINEGVSRSQFHSTNRNWSSGSSTGVNFGASGGVPFGIFSMSAGISSQKSTGESIGSAEGTTYANSFTYSRSENKGKAETQGSATEQGKSLQISTENRSVKSFLAKIDLYLERLDTCENYGAFECAAYVLADEPEYALAVAGHYNALMRGDDSFVQSSQVNIWSPPYRRKQNEKKTPVELISKYLQVFSHPEFFLNPNRNNVTVRPSSLVSGKELAIQFALPKKSIPGLTVIEMTPFGRNVAPSDGRKLELGALYYMGREESGNTRVRLNAESLTAHTFITGSTGSGKSNTLYHMLNQLEQQGIGYLVIEPAKGEYKNVLGGRSGVAVWGTNPYKTRLLRLNPFAFPSSVHVLEHIDRLIEVFSACWPMYAAMPAILKDAVEQAYEMAGWNLRLSRSPGRFPDFTDLMEVLPQVIDRAEYSSDTGSDYKGALCTRVHSLTNGIHGMIFSQAQENDFKELLRTNAIVDLSLIGSAETKALIMGILVLKLQEHRMDERDNGGTGTDRELRHITVLEEAHHLLRRTYSEQAQESSNLQGKSVEMLANAIAEMRTYGEGFIIADQSPGLLDMSVIRNTNTKIILRLPDEGDRQLVGKAAGLNDEQVAELAKLETGVAAISQNNWWEPVLCKVDEFKEKLPYQYTPYWQDEETAALKKFIRGVFGFKLELTAEEVDLIRRWRDRLKNNHLYRISELVIEKRPLSGEEKLVFIREIAGAKLTRLSDRESAVREAQTTVCAKFDLSEHDEVIRELHSLFLNYFPSNIVVETGAEKNEPLMKDFQETKKSKA